MLGAVDHGKIIRGARRMLSPQAGGVNGEITGGFFPQARRDAAFE